GAHHHGTGAIFLLLAPRAGANLVGLDGDDRLHDAALGNALVVLGDGAAAAYRDLANVFLVHGPVGGPAHRHLVLLHALFVSGVALLAHVLLIDGLVSRPA